MIEVVATLAALLAAAAPAAAHSKRVEHRGAAYDVTYHPHVSAAARTVGVHAGTRMSQQRCRWTITVEVDRQIRQPGGGEALTRRLAGERRFSGSTAGACERDGRTIKQAQAERATAITAHVLALASTDRPALLAEIDAARALALN